MPLCTYLSDGNIALAKASIADDAELCDLLNQVNSLSKQTYIVRKEKIRRRFRSHYVYSLLASTIEPEWQILNFGPELRLVNSFWSIPLWYSRATISAYLFGYLSAAKAGVEK